MSDLQQELELKFSQHVLKQSISKRYDSQSSDGLTDANSAANPSSL